MPPQQGTDVVVVGAGAGGGFAALGLVEAGLRVTLLERGRQYHAREFPMNHDDWELRRAPFVPSPVGDPSVVMERGAPIGPDGATRGAFRYDRVWGLGGSTVHYQGEAHRFPAHAFRDTEGGTPGGDWPLSYDELAPYYERAEQVLGVAGEPGNPFRPSRGPFPTPAHPLSPGSRRVAAGARQLGWSLRPNTLALPTRSVDGRPPCQRSGGCVYGCIFGAKSSTDLAALNRARNTGRLTVLTAARAVEIETGPGDRVTGVVYRHHGRRRRQRARAVVLAGGAIETPRLLLASRSGRHPGGIGNASGNVGRHLMETVIARHDVRYDERLEPWKGPPIDARLWDFSVPRGQEAGFVLGVSGTMGAFHGPVSYALRLPGIGPRHRARMRSTFGTILTLFGIAEQQPQPGNRLWLAQETDDDGVPKVHVRCGYSARDRRAVDTMHACLDALEDASGAAGTVVRRDTILAAAASHVGGTCRMGADPALAVVDALGRVHGTRNLFIADASVLVNQGAGDSPSLTVQALALRLAGHLARLVSRREI